MPHRNHSWNIPTEIPVGIVANGLMECWNDGKYWNSGIMEYWNDGLRRMKEH
jgi:hypothetical protein